MAPSGPDLTTPHANPASAPAGTLPMPRVLYGTAWKAERTADLVCAALVAGGFRGVDTAAQPRHYREDLVGEGIRRALAATGPDGKPVIEGGRAALFIQTKYSPPSSHDPGAAPYDEAADVRAQVRQSVAGSLANLGVGVGVGAGGEEEAPYLDSVVLHSPLASAPLTQAAYAALCEFVASGAVRRVGISNAGRRDVELLGRFAARAGLPQPSVVQNRFYARTGWDAGLRAWARGGNKKSAKEGEGGGEGESAGGGLVYQTFWTLTGNPGFVGWSKDKQPTEEAAPFVERLAAGAGVAREAAFYSLVLGLGDTSVLDGTTSEEHMLADLGGIRKVQEWAGGSEEAARVWEECLAEFKETIGELKDEVDDE